MMNVHIIYEYDIMDDIGYDFDYISNDNIGDKMNI